MKGRGLLAVLGISRGLRQTKTHLQDLLYSRSEPEQGAASIRQLLREIRLALDDRRDVLRSGPGWIGLDMNSVIVDLTPRPGPDGRPLEFAADLDIPDPEFENWLRDTRMHVENRAVAPAAPLSAGPPRLMVQSPVSTDPDAALLAEMLMMEAALRASDITPLIVIQPDDGAEMQADLVLRVRALRGADRTMLSASLVQTGTAHVIWNQSFHIETGSSRMQTHLCAADMTFAILKAAEAADALNQTRRFPLGDIFSYSRLPLMRADQVLDTSYDQLRPAVALALRAYIRNTLLIERLTDDPAGALDEADEFSRRALELAPHNATVLAVAAVIASYRNHKETEYRLVQQAVRADPLNPLAMFAHSLVLSDLDRHQEAASIASDGMNSALSALNPATWLLRRSAASFRHGDLEGAQRFFAATHQMAPDNRPALRFLAALLYHNGDHEGARQALIKLKQIEPDFSLDLMASDGYPVDSLRNAGMLAITRSGLI
ncbi:MAG: SARP family transcriptional regulator [Paracoccus sp. (in: a-proteobacteria)]|uniref:tetratricopeptide repeat protein n=1 Tax=Paracoccus sp. TaxID=267 RepID=UPI0026E01799|nr:tetratricopeptide repeat protein [Paracoccus sp. (in: a-proteobacteria)]MDO5631924.1 SARP family transcriptional regulator [Paracoccus sp. (in: a-proteobacteria)]